MPLEERPSGSTHHGPSSVYKHKHTPALFNTGITWDKGRGEATYELLLFSNSAEMKSWWEEAVKKKAQRYSLGRETSKTSSALQVCFSACTGKSTCYVIREHMLLSSATSHSGSYRMRTENKCLKPKTTFVQRNKYWQSNSIKQPLRYPHRHKREKTICDKDNKNTNQQLPCAWTFFN